MKEINWRKGERLVWPDGRREREVRRHGREECQTAAQFQEKLFQEARLRIDCLWAKVMCRRIPCLAGWTCLHVPSALSHQLGDTRGKCGACINAGVPAGSSVWGRQSWTLCRRIQVAHFHDCNNPPPSRLTVYCSQQFREQPAISRFPEPSLAERRGQWDKW